MLYSFRLEDLESDSIILGSVVPVSSDQTTLVVSKIPVSCNTGGGMQNIFARYGAVRRMIPRYLSATHAFVDFYTQSAAWDCFVDRKSVFNCRSAEVFWWDSISIAEAIPLFALCDRKAGFPGKNNDNKGKFRTNPARRLRRRAFEAVERLNPGLRKDDGPFNDSIDATSPDVTDQLKTQNVEPVAVLGIAEKVSHSKPLKVTNAVVLEIAEKVSHSKPLKVINAITTPAMFNEVIDQPVSGKRNKINNPWITDEIISDITNKDVLYKAWSKTRTKENGAGDSDSYIQFKEFRRTLKHKIKLTKLEYHESIGESVPKVESEKEPCLSDLSNDELVEPCVVEIVDVTPISTVEIGVATPISTVGTLKEKLSNSSDLCTTESPVFDI